MATKLKKQLGKTEQEIERLEREVRVLESAEAPEKACSASIDYAIRQKEPMLQPNTAEDPNPWIAPPNTGCCTIM